MNQNAEDELLVEQFKTAVDGLYYTSETDASIEVSLWDTPADAVLSPGLVIQQTAHTANTPTQEVNIEDFFCNCLQDEDWYGEEEKAIAQRFRHLVDLIHQHLTDVHIYRLGQTSMDVYIIGKTPSNKWLALSTQVVET